MAKTYTPVILADDEYAKQSANVEATRAAKAEADRAEREAFFEPLKSALDSECGKSFYQSLDSLRHAFDGDEYSENENIRAHLGAILSVMPNFYNIVGVNLSEPVDMTPVAGPVEPEA